MNWPWAVVTCISVICCSAVVAVALVVAGRQAGSGQAEDDRD